MGTTAFPWEPEGAAKRGRVSVKKAEVEKMGRFGVAQDVGEALPRAREGGCSRAVPAGGAQLSPVWPEESAGAPHCGRSVARVPEAAPAMKEGGSSLLRAPPRRHRAAGPLSQLPRVGFHVADFEPAPTAGLSRRKAAGCGVRPGAGGRLPPPPRRGRPGVGASQSLAVTPFA